MDSVASKPRYEIQHFQPSAQTEEKNRTTGVLAATGQTPVPRAQFFSIATSCLKTIGSRICKALDSAVNAVNRVRGVWALNSISFRNETPEKMLTQIKFLKKIIGNEDEKIKRVVNWGAGEIERANLSRESREHHFHSVGSLFFAILNSKELRNLIAKENDAAELRVFYGKLCIELYARYKEAYKLVYNQPMDYDIEMPMDCADR